MTFTYRHWPVPLLILAIAWIFSPALHSFYDVTEDHEMITVVGETGHMPARELAAQIGGAFSEGNSRFRPAYLALRSVEYFLTGRDPIRLRFDRLVLAVVAGVALYFLFATFLSALPAAVGALLLFAGTQNLVWVSIVDQESYGVVCALLGFLALARRFSLTGLGLLALASLFKESFIPLLPAAMGFVYIVLPHFFPRSVFCRPTRREWPAILAFSALFLAEAAIVLYKIKTYGHVYSSHFSWAHAAAAARFTLGEYTHKTLWVLPFGAAFIYLAAGARQSAAPLITFAALAAFGFSTLFAPQWILYAENFGTGRYLTPGNFGALYLMALGFYYLPRGTGEYRGIVTGMLLFVTLMRVNQAHQGTEVFAHRTMNFKTQLAQLAQAKAAHPEYPLVFCMRSPTAMPLANNYAVILSKLGVVAERPVLTLHADEAETLSPLYQKYLDEYREFRGDDRFRAAGASVVTADHAIGVVFDDAGEQCDFKFRFTTASLNE